MNGVLRQSWRLGGVAGIASFIVLALGFLSFEPPVYDDPAEELRAFWVENGQQVLVVYYFVALSLVFLFLPFLVTFRSLLGRAEGGEQVCSRVAFLGGFLAVISFLGEGPFWGVLAFGNFAETASDEIITTLMLLDNYVFALLPVTFAVLTLFSSIVIARTGVVWKWLAIPGGIIPVLAGLAPLGLLSSESDDIFDIFLIISFAASLVWILLVSIAMVLRQDEVNSAG